MAPRSKTRRAYELAREIFELEQRLHEKRVEFERLVSGTPEQLLLPLRPRESCPARLRALFAERGDQEAIAFHEIVQGMSDVHPETVRATVSKFVTAKEVQRVGPGLYRAAPRDEKDETSKVEGGSR